MEELVVLFVMPVRAHALHGGFDVAVGDEDVQPAVVIVIEETTAETKHLDSRCGDSRRITDLRERSTVVAPKMVRLVLKIGDKQAGPTVVVVVAEIDVHAG